MAHYQSLALVMEVPCPALVTEGTSGMCVSYLQLYAKQSGSDVTHQAKHINRSAYEAIIGPLHCMPHHPCQRGRVHGMNIGRIPVKLMLMERVTGTVS